MEGMKKARFSGTKKKPAEAGFCWMATQALAPSALILADRRLL
jgi:hypothetical protein